MITAMKQALEALKHAIISSGGETCYYKEFAAVAALEAAIAEAARQKSVSWSYTLQPPQGFVDYVAANYSGDVVFSDPEWHAKRLWGAAMRNTAPADCGRAVEYLKAEFNELRAERDELRAAVQSALSQLCWREFGECRVDDKPIPTPAEVEKQLRDALKERP